ncbi:MAG: hypothetical protein K2K24_02635, partial [Clostridia bacterium]|nr:hypothetical protein [Clostridia bacterium]
MMMLTNGIFGLLQFPLCKAGKENTQNTPKNTPLAAVSRFACVERQIVSCETFFRIYPSNIYDFRRIL